MGARGVAALAGALAFLVIAPGPVGATDAPQREGWWGRSVHSAVPADPPAALPVPLPLTPPTVPAAVPSPALPAPDVPAGAVAVAAVGGQVHRVAAIGFSLDSSAGVPAGVLLTLREADAPTGQLGTGGVVACPIDGYWAPEAGTDLATAPAADCSGSSATGVRHDDGTWSFDLTSMAASLTDGVRLNPVTDAGATFQVLFTGADGATLTVTPAGPVSSDLGADGGYVDSPASGYTTDLGSSSVVTPPRAARRTGPVTHAVGPGQAVSSLLPRGRTGLPASALLLAVLAAVVAVLAMWTLGPNREPAPVDRPRRRQVEVVP